MTILDRLSLNCRVAMVTGGAGGIGHVVAEQLRDLGATTVLADRAQSSADVAESLGGKAKKVDWVSINVTDSKSVDSAIVKCERRHGRLDILVAAAGVSYEQETLDHSDENWRNVMAINRDGVFYCIRAAGRRRLEAAQLLLSHPLPELQRLGLRCTLDMMSPRLQLLTCAAISL